MKAQIYRKPPAIVGIKGLKRTKKVRLKPASGIDERKRYLTDKTIKKLDSMQGGPARSDSNNEADRALNRMVSDRGLMGTVRRKR